MNMKLSVITINYNNNKGLLETIESVKSQIYSEFEFIIIDGNSTDGSKELIEKTEGIHYWISEPDNGAYSAMNKGVNVATGDYCVFMNSGDVFYDRNVLEHIIPLLDGTDVITGSTWLSFGRLVSAPKDVPMRYLFKGTLCHQSSFIKRSLLLEYPYDETLRYVSDWKFWIQTLVFADYTYKAIDTIISIYDWSGMSTVNYVDCDAEKLKVLNDFFPKKVVSDYEKFVCGTTWEDKLYIEMKSSQFHTFFYSMNVLLLRILSFFKKRSRWVQKYPFKFSDLNGNKL